MVKRDSCKPSAEESAVRERRKQYLKTGLAAFVALALCCWVAYRWFHPGMTEKYNDFAIDSAVGWLEKADRQDFEACRKSATDAAGWFDWFVTDRKSLGKVKERTLAIRQSLPDAAPEMKRYELKFDSRFGKSSSRGSVSERVVVETDGKSRFKVLAADYWLSRGIEFSGHPVGDTEKARIKAAAEQALKKAEAGDMAFFKRIYGEWLKGPDYFGWQKYIVNDAKDSKNIAGLGELLRKGKATPFTLARLDTYIPLGRTGFECSSVVYRFSVNINGKTQNFNLRMFVNRDLYLNKDAEWKFAHLMFREEKKK